MQFSMQFTVLVVVVMEPDGRERPHVLHTPPHPVIHPIPSNPIPSEMAFSNLHIYMAALSFVVCTKVVNIGSQIEKNGTSLAEE